MKKDIQTYRVDSDDPGDHTHVVAETWGAKITDTTLWKDRFDIDLDNGVTLVVKMARGRLEVDRYGQRVRTEAHASED